MTQTSKIDVLDPDQVFVSDLDDWNKLYLLGFIVESGNREHGRSAARYICEMIGKDAGLVFIALVSYYALNCPDVPYPTLTDFEEALKRAVESLT